MRVVAVPQRTLRCGKGQVAVARVTLERFRMIPLTTRLTDEEVLALLPHVEEVSLSEGEALFEQGDPAVYVYYVEQGMVAEVQRVPISPDPVAPQRATGVQPGAQQSEGDLAQPSAQGATGVQPGAQQAEGDLAQPSARGSPGPPPTTKEVVQRYAGQGEYLGRYALVTGQPFRISTVAEVDSVLLAIPLRYMQPILFAHDDWRTWFFRSDVATRLRAVPLFMDLDDWDLYRLADATVVTEHAAGAIIFEPGDEADCLYIVDRGQVIEPLPPPNAPREEWPRYFGPGNFFGQFGLQQGKGRLTTTRARLATRLFCISEHTIKQLLAGRTDEILQELARVDLPGRLRTIPRFSSLTREHLHLLSGYVCLEYHRPGDIVARQGEPATSLMMMIEGEAVVRLQFGRGQPRTVTHFKAHRRGSRADASEGNYFGAHALLEEELRGATVEVTRSSVWLTLHRDDFERFMQETGLSAADLDRGSAPDLDLPYKVHQHWLVPVSRILPLALLFYLVLELVVSDLLGEGLVTVGFVLLVGLAVAMLYFFVNWLDNTLEVTTWSVIHTKRNLLFKLEWAEIPLRQIDRVDVSSNSVSRWFGAGDLAIKAARGEVKGDTEGAREPGAETYQIDFKMAPSADSVQDLVQRAIFEEVWATDFRLPLPAKIRRHWLLAAFLILPLIFLCYLLLDQVMSGALGGGSVVVALVFFAGSVATICYLFVYWLDDALEVTPHNLIRTRRNPNARLERKEIPLHQVQGASASTKHPLFGAGTLTIDLPPRMEQICLTMIPSPDSVRDLILKAVSEEGTTGADGSLLAKIRQHWLVAVSRILPLMLLFYLLLDLLVRGVLGGWLVAFGVMLLVGIVVAVPYLFFHWLDDTLEVTARSLIRSRRKLDAKLERVEIPLTRVQGASASSERRLFGSGTLTIDLTPRKEQISLAMIPSPPSARDLILTAAASEEAQTGAPAPSPEGEVLLPYKVRRHWVVPVLSLVPLGTIIFLIVLTMGTGVLGSLTLPLGILGLVMFGSWALYSFVDWMNDAYEVTTRAVIHTENKLLVSAQRYEIPLQQIQNVTVRVGVIGRYLGFGNIAIDTAAQRGQIAFTTIPRPAYVQQLIQKAATQARSGMTVQRQESIRQQIEDQLYPERLKPDMPGSIQIPPEEPPEEERRRFRRFRDLRGWFPRFEIREDGQVIWRKHWINLLQRTGFQFLLFLLSIYLVMAFALASFTVSLGAAAILLPPVAWIGFHGWLFLVILFLSALAALWFLYQYVDWRNDVYIVTDDEVIDVERELVMFPFFFWYNESRKQASLTKVQYVDLKIPNPLAMILNYGNVIVQTAGAEGTLDFLWVSNPRNVHAEILRRVAAFEERERERQYQERWADMPRWFETYRDVIDQTGQSKT